ncbi:MAG: biopolymer transporter ExbD, partial [Gemmataceae bacterium]|nr:biopolymer transporter ExbD [Gemmataceae bacterium]
TNPAQVKTYMDRRNREDMRRKPKEGEAKATPSLLIVRADKECPFEKVYAVMKACRMAGYERAQLRAIRFGGKIE